MKEERIILRLSDVLFYLFKNGCGQILTRSPL